MAGDAAGTARKLGKCRECRAEQAEGDVARGWNRGRKRQLGERARDSGSG